MSIHLLHPVTPPLRVAGVCWSLSQVSWGKGGVKPWAGRQIIAGPHRKTNSHTHLHISHTHMDNLGFTVLLTCMILDCGRTCKLHKEIKHRVKPATFRVAVPVIVAI